VGAAVAVTSARVEVVEASRAQKPLLANLLELYQYDFTEFDAVDVDDTGRFGAPFLDVYWDEPGRHPFLLRVDGNWAGAALVRSGRPNDMAEFFVMRKYRGDGVGTQFARELFARFTGEWTVRELEANTPAQAFWRRAIPVAFQEDVWAKGPMQRFTIA
jgi:predicted acetyltransferase